ncbi:hypothetical protein C8J57DRAFT_1250901 [Mycena rebaudengoi]|nr:hypothetical protein C8J57DRAFT_1250901 [Mycena rebaudengoi]
MEEEGIKTVEEQKRGAAAPSSVSTRLFAHHNARGVEHVARGSSEASYRVWVWEHDAGGTMVGVGVRRAVCRRKEKRLEEKRSDNERRRKKGRVGAMSGHAEQPGHRPGDSLQARRRRRRSEGAKKEGINRRMDKGHRSRQGLRDTSWASIAQRQTSSRVGCRTGPDVEANATEPPRRLLPDGKNARKARKTNERQSKSLTSPPRGKYPRELVAHAMQSMRPP